MKEFYFYWLWKFYLGNNMELLIYEKLKKLTKQIIELFSSENQILYFL